MINKKPLIKFLLWVFSLLLIIVLGITNVFADTYNYNQFTAQLYDNNGPTLSAVSTSQTNNRWQGTIPTMTANSAGAAWGVSSNMVLLSNHTYTLTAQITGTYGGRLVLSTYNRIGVGTTLANAKSSYQNNSYVNENYSRVLDDGYTIQFAFTPTTNGSYIVFPFATNYTGNNQAFYLTNFTIDDLGSGGVSESTINNSLNTQTNVLNQSITNSQNSIIQNQNENNQALQDTINDNFNSCNSYLLYNNFNYVVYNNNFDLVSGSNYIGFVPKANGSGSTLTGYFVIPNNLKNTDMTITFDGYNNNGFTPTIFIYGDGLSGSNIITSGMSSTISFNSGNYSEIFIGFYLQSSSYTTANYVTITNLKINNYCSNKIDETNDKLNDLNNSINDDDVDSSSWANFFNNFTTNTFGLTSIITAPLNLIQSLSSSTCTDLQIPLPYLNNKYLTLPCMSSIYSQYFGNFFTLYQTITFGIIAYWVCVRIFNLVKDFKNPEHDEIEVVDL